MQIRRYVLFFLYFSLQSTVFAAPADSLVEIKIYKTSFRYFYEKDFIYGRIPIHDLDTSVSRIHLVNPNMDLHYNYLGTLGSAGCPQVCRETFKPFTFTSIHSYDIQMLISDSIKYIHTNKRFTEVSYHNGNFKEQQVSIMHSQNITKTWNAGLVFDRQGVKDFMNFSDTYRSRFSLFTSYGTPNNRYNLFANATWNTIKNSVNGGLVSDSLFVNTDVNNLGIKGLAYQISNAEQHERRKSFFLSQYYDLGKSQVKDSGEIPQHHFPVLRLHHEISLERKSFVYLDSDPDSNFYFDYYYGASTYDSLHSDEIRNRIAIQLPADETNASAFFRNVNTGIFADYSHVNYGQRTDSTWNIFSVGANIFLKSDSASPELFTEGIYVINGIDEKNYSIKLKAFSPFLKFGRFGILAETGSSPADLIYRWYDSNNFYWKNNFSTIKNLKTGISYDLDKYQIHVDGSRNIIDNYVYLNSNAFPDQYTGTLTIDQVNFIKNFKFRFWHFDNTITWQKSDNEEIKHLPEFVSDQSIYIEKYYFKNALLTAMGMSVNYNSSFYADAFMPANAMFYLQSTTKTGGYARIDLFINIQIKTARIFIRLENAADNLFEKSYFLTPHYPMPGRVLKFGLVWRFFDQ